MKNEWYGTEYTYVYIHNIHTYVPGAIDGVIMCVSVYRVGMRITG